MGILLHDVTRALMREYYEDFQNDPDFLIFFDYFFINSVPLCHA